MIQRMARMPKVAGVLLSAGAAVMTSGPCTKTPVSVIVIDHIEPLSEN